MFLGMFVCIFFSIYLQMFYHLIQKLAHSAQINPKGQNDFYIVGGLRIGVCVRVCVDSHSRIAAIEWSFSAHVQKMFDPNTHLNMKRAYSYRRNSHGNTNRIKFIF